MSLRDLACYTLTLKPSTQDVKVTELTATEGRAEEARYARVRETADGEVYSSSIYDALSGARLASVGFASEKQKNRRLQLHNPDENVSFDNTSKLGFEWTFVFEGNKYRWTREVYGKDYICSLDRKPDPRVEICLARDADSKGPGRLQILHYNIERFPNEIKDLRGLETLLVASLMCFVDVASDRSNPGSTARISPVPSKAAPTAGPSTTAAGAGVPAGSSPPTITADDYEDESDPNEILVGTNTDIGEHIARAVGLLEDPNMLFIVIRTKTASASQKALEVSLGVKRIRHREGMGDLHQYVVEEDPVRAPKPTPPKKGPTIINLDDRPPALPASKPKWSGPPNIAIYLSSIELPDLKPKPKSKPQTPSVNGAGSAHPAPVRPPPPSTQQGAKLQARPPPPRADGPHGSVGALSAPPQQTTTAGKDERKSSFGRLFGR